MEFLIDLFRGLLGIAAIIGICFLISNNKRKVDWKIVLVGIAMQFVIAIVLLRVEAIRLLFEDFVGGVVTFLSFSDVGAKFLFGSLTTDGSFGAIFAFKILPIIVFFSAITAILYHFGILQRVVYGLAWVMSKTMKLTGAESLAAAANVFIGQTEAPLVVKPYLKKMSDSELFCLMTGGMATIAGSVFAAFILFLGGESDQMKVEFGKHLLTASLMSAPAAILVAKVMVPETKKELNRELDIAMDNPTQNILDAIVKGTLDGLKLAVNVGVMLMVFIALIAVLNWILSGFGSIDWAIGASEFTINQWISGITAGQYQQLDCYFILGILFAPIAWLIGTPSEDLFLMGQLLGQKTVINEFVAYENLGQLLEQSKFTHNKSIIIATYALCGFANFSSIGIQIGGIGALAPNKKGVLTKLGFRALIGGTAAALLTAAVAGIIV